MKFFNQRKHFEETIAGYQRDRKTVADESSVRKEHDAKQIWELHEKVRKLRELSRSTIKEILELKKDKHQQERKFSEERVKMTEELLELRAKNASEQSQIEAAVKAVENRLIRRHDETVDEMRQALQKTEDDLRISKLKVEASEQSAAKKTSYLNSRIQALTASYNSLKRRRDYEIEGFTNDILLLRKQLKVLEKSILKYGPLEDRELVLLNLARETSEKAAKISTDLQGLKTKILSTENDVKALTL